MVNSILIGKVIYSLLSNHEELKEKLQNRIYPLVAENSTKYPFIVFYRNTINNTTMKDGFANDTVSFTIMVVDNSYSRSTEVANTVRSICEFKKKQFSDMLIVDSHLTSIDEAFYEDAYIQTLVFTAKVY